jgi:hypothetical protein
MSRDRVYPQIMNQAREDLMGHVSGRFSPEDWNLILERAAGRLEAFQSGGVSELQAWQEVVREFHRERYWGFSADYKPPKVKRPEINLGVKFILFGLLTMTVFMTALVWLGQIHTHSDDPKDGWIFYSVVALVVLNFILFLWKNGRSAE